MIRHHPIQFASRRQSLVHLVAHGRIVLVALVAKDVAQPVGGVVQIVGAVLGIRLQACHPIDDSAHIAGAPPPDAPGALSHKHLYERSISDRRLRARPRTRFAARRIFTESSQPAVT